MWLIVQVYTKLGQHPINFSNVAPQKVKNWCVLTRLHDNLMGRFWHFQQGKMCWFANMQQHSCTLKDSFLFSLLSLHEWQMGKEKKAKLVAFLVIGQKLHVNSSLFLNLKNYSRPTKLFSVHSILWQEDQRLLKPVPTKVL